MEKPYRLNAGMIVFNSRGEVLAGDRIQYPGHFQLPQGGIDRGEDPEGAAIRELHEEVGLKLNSAIGHIPGWLSYEFPEDIPEHLKKFRGQKQKWFYFYWDGDPSSLDLEHHEREFNSVRWCPLPDLVNQIISFKQDVYSEILVHASEFIPAYIRSLPGSG